MATGVECAMAFKDGVPHTAVLHKLEQRIGDLLLSREPFKQSDWRGVPLVFASEHPDPEKLTENLSKEINRLGGSYEGAILTSRVVEEGTPRLEVEMPPFASERVRQLHKEGRLGISSCFYCNSSEDEKGRTVSGTVLPNHVLLFELTEKDQPRDKGTFFMNKGDRHMADELATIRETYESVLKNKEDELVAVRSSVAEKEASIASFKEKVTSLEKEVEAFKAAEKIRIDKEREAKWLSFKELIPKGLVHEEADEKLMKERFMDNPQELAIDVLRKIREAPKPQANKEGVEEANTEIDALLDDYHKEGGF